MSGSGWARAERAWVGIDMDAALSFASARGCDLVVLSELVPAAEAGLVEAWCAHRGPGSCTYSDDSGLS